MRAGAKVILIILCVIIIAALLVLLTGCAAGRGPAGEIIIGMDVARLPENTTELANAAAGFLPPPWSAIATTAIGLFGAGAAAYGAKKRGEERGWDQREQHQTLVVDRAWDEAELHAQGRTAWASSARGAAPSSSASGLSAPPWAMADAGDDQTAST